MRIKNKKPIKFFLLGVLLVVVIVFVWLFVYQPFQAAKISWGVDFSQKHSQNLGLNWQETYLAFLEDLGAKNLKINTAWDLLEPQKDKYQFADLDWQINQAQSHQAKILLVIGMKTPRWPECHLPDWVKTLSKQEQQTAILGLLQTIVLRYQQNQTIWAWQVENEPFFSFGDCPWRDDSFFKKEVVLVKSLDSRPLIISSSGEWSAWFKEASLSDVVGMTLYRQAWMGWLNRSLPYYFGPEFYRLKSDIIKKIFGKKVICIELQAEPWGKKLIYDIPIAEQLKLFDHNQFLKNVDFAKRTGLDTFYLWGGEWWYWMKEKQGDDYLWQTAKTLF
jgi:beta-galactosidase GanA